MPLSWNEIKSRAATFSKEWELETSEDAEAKSFRDDFFNIFGISRRRVATFEQIVNLYDPLTMPPKLVKAHNELDKAVDLCYRSQPFVNETKRIEFFFELYEKYTAGMFRVEKKGKRK